MGVDGLPCPEVEVDKESMTCRVALLRIDMAACKSDEHEELLEQEDPARLTVADKAISS